MQRIQFGDKSFFVSQETSTQPLWVAQSFVFEAAMREKWWKVRPGDIVFDVGAAYGSYTLPAIASGAALVIAFEPHRESFYDLCMNLNINSFMPKCIPLNLIAGDNDMLSSVEYYPDMHSTTTGKKKDVAYSISIDEIVRKYHLARVDWIKIDVEGDELRVLHGALTTIAQFRPKILVENHVGYNPNIEYKIKSLMTPRSYTEQDRVKGTGINDSWTLWTPS